MSLSSNLFNFFQHKNSMLSKSCFKSASTSIVSEINDVKSFLKKLNVLFSMVFQLFDQNSEKRKKKRNISEDFFARRWYKGGSKGNEIFSKYFLRNEENIVDCVSTMALKTSRAFCFYYRRSAFWIIHRIVAHSYSKPMYKVLIYSWDILINSKPNSRSK